jgi:hypothetical protein
MLGMLLNETLLLQEEAQMSKEAGFIRITNARLLWNKLGDSIPRINVNRLQITEVEIAQFA